MGELSNTGRLVALNKCHPKVGQVEDYRPITVLSPLVKFVEGWYNGDLKKWSRSHL